MKKALHLRQLPQQKKINIAFDTCLKKQCFRYSTLRLRNASLAFFTCIVILWAEINDSFTVCLNKSCSVTNGNVLGEWKQNVWFRGLLSSFTFRHKLSLRHSKHINGLLRYIRITESFRLKKPYPAAAKSTNKPCPQVPQLHIF